MALLRPIVGGPDAADAALFLYYVYIYLVHFGKHMRDGAHMVMEAARVTEAPLPALWRRF